MCTFKLSKNFYRYTWISNKFSLTLTARYHSYFLGKVGSVKPVEIGSINMAALLSNLLSELAEAPPRAHPPASACPPPCANWSVTAGSRPRSRAGLSGSEVLRLAALGLAKRHPVCLVRLGMRAEHLKEERERQFGRARSSR